MKMTLVGLLHKLHNNLRRSELLYAKLAKCIMIFIEMDTIFIARMVQNICSVSENVDSPFEVKEIA